MCVCVCVFVGVCVTYYARLEIKSSLKDLILISIGLISLLSGTGQLGGQFRRPNGFVLKAIGWKDLDKLELPWK